MTDNMTTSTAPAAHAEGKTDSKPDTKPEAATETKEAADGNAGSGAETEGSGSDAPAGYSRGENQKPVTNAYRANWDKIFGKKG